MPGESGTARIAWIAAVAIAWPTIAIGGFHLSWGTSPPLPPVAGVLGIGLLIAAPGALAIASAEESRRWRRIMGATVATTSAIGVIGYGVLVFDSVGCGQPGDAVGVAVSMVLVALTVGVGAGVTSWQGGRLVAAHRRAGIPLAFVLGWAWLALSLAAAVVRVLSVSCFGY